MYAKSFTLAILSASVLGAEFSQIVSHDFGAMLRRGNAITKRQGYYPTSTPCGSGDTCEEACGAGQVECPADVGIGVCFDPSAGHCCPDGSGYSCDTGYFCSSDGQDNTYCCPDGMDLGACAEAYSLTVSLISQTGTVTIASESASASVATPTTPIYITSIPSSSSTPIYITSLPTATATDIPTGNGSYTTSAPPAEFPGVAAKVGGAGMAIIVAVAGLAGTL